MKIVCHYNKNLKMSEGKLAAQVGHVCKNIALEMNSYGVSLSKNDTIVVLGLRQNKFKEKMDTLESLNSFTYIQKDLGFTEVEKGTITVFGYTEKE